MTDASSRMTSHRPYLLRALHEWIADNGLTPHLLVDATRPGVRVPTHAVKDGRIVLNIAERAVLQNRRGSGSIASLLMADNEATGPAMTTEGKPLKEYVEAFERMLIDNTMRRHKGSIVAVMEELCLPRRTLNEKMAKYGLSRGDYT